MFKDWGIAVDKCVQNVGNAKDVATLSCIPAVFHNVVNALLMFGGFFALFILITAGFKYMNSAGDPKKLEGARGTLTYGIIGLILVLLSFFIINIISFVTGVPCITTFGFGCK